MATACIPNQRQSQGVQIRKSKTQTGFVSGSTWQFSCLAKNGGQCRKVERLRSQINGLENVLEEPLHKIRETESRETHGK